MGHHLKFDKLKIVYKKFCFVTSLSVAMTYQLLDEEIKRTIEHILRQISESAPLSAFNEALSQNTIRDVQVIGAVGIEANALLGYQKFVF